MDDLLPFEIPTNHSSIIKAIGVGGGGGNAVNHMFSQGIKGVDFIVCNTDAQALAKSPVPVRIQLGITLTEGLGAGNKPEKGKEAAVENIEDIKKELVENTKMIFITAGMGGGTGTGAAPVIAEAAKELGLLTVAIVTIPFRHEGPKRKEQAIAGIAEISKSVDSLLVINNEKLREVYGDLEVHNAFRKADDILTVAVKGIAEIITVHGYVNVDFADVRTVMADSGVAIMGTGFGEGENRAIEAVKDALNSPLLNNNDVEGAKNLLLNIISGEKPITLDEIGAINDFVQAASGHGADLIWGNTTDTDLGDKIGVTVVATGFKYDIIPELWSQKQNIKTIHNLDDKSKIKIQEITDVQMDVVNTQKQDETKENKKIEIIKQQATKTENVNNNNTEFKVIEKQEEEINIEKIENKKLKQKEKKENEINSIKEKIKNNKKEPLNSQQYKNIDELEKIPAFKRKQMEIDMKKELNKTNIDKINLEDNKNE